MKVNVRGGKLHVSLMTQIYEKLRIHLLDCQNKAKKIFNFFIV